MKIDGQEEKKKNGKKLVTIADWRCENEIDIKMDIWLIKCTMGKKINFIPFIFVRFSYKKTIKSDETHHWIDSIQCIRVTYSKSVTTKWNENIATIEFLRA